MSPKRFYIFTGKGGVGKTTLSLTFTKHLLDQGVKVKLAYFTTSKLEDDSIKYQEVKRKAEVLGVDALGLDLLSSAEAYIAKKLGSKTIAGWVVKTPFFKSLINMIPGFNYLIYMGQILEYLKEDPDLVIVLDSPSSGHALTMFEATKNFNQIFQKGALYNDTEEMIELLRSPNFVRIFLVTLPSILPLKESAEFVQQLQSIEPLPIEIICNYSLVEFENLDLPQALQLKLLNEKEALENTELSIKEKLPFRLANDTNTLSKELLPSMENLV